GAEADRVLGGDVGPNDIAYLGGTNALIQLLATLFVGEFDEEASRLGTKGLGELTAVSVAPAIGNAVYHATGKRVRDLPITVEKLLCRLGPDVLHHDPSARPMTHSRGSDFL